VTDNLNSPKQQDTVYVAFSLGGGSHGEIEGIYRTHEAAEASFTCGKKHTDNWDPEPDYRQTGQAGDREWHAANCTHHAVSDWHVEGLPVPRRGDAVETWLKAQRDLRLGHDGTEEAYAAIDQLLDLYRLHADTGTPLDQHTCENGTVDDCYGCYEAAKEEQR
jgi:hypothetical protein